MFPFYCNKCFRRRKYDISLELFVSRCGHILCRDCLNENCGICSRPFSPVAINKDMPTSMAEYFSSPMKQYQHYKKVMKFHHEQEKRLVDHLCKSNAEENKKLDNELKGYAKLNDTIKKKIEHERERIRKLREYTSYYDRRFEQARYMTPPIVSQPRPRFMPRSQSDDNGKVLGGSSVPKRFTTPIRPNIVFPKSPTLSCDNSSSVPTERSPVANAVSKKARTPPALIPFTQQKILNPHFSFDSSI